MARGSKTNTDEEYTQNQFPVSQTMTEKFKKIGINQYISNIGCAVQTPDYRF